MARKKQSRKLRKVRRTLILLLILIIIFAVLSFITPTRSELDGGSGQTATIEDLELPSPIEGEQIIRHTGYTLSYNEEHELPSYVAYELTRAEVLGGGEREDSFKEDKAVRTGSAERSDYRGSGYDRGHMAPAADFKWSAEAMSDTFFLSNMAPQDPSFNRGIWADLEAVVRTMAYENGSVYVVTGPVLTDGPYETIGKNEVSVPRRFYKVVLDYTEPEIKAIGFVLPNEGSDRSLQSYAVSVDEVEEITGLDFYPRLPDEEEGRIEAECDPSLWSFNAFVPTGESADVEYVAPSGSIADDVLSLILSLFVDLKTEVFDLLGLSGIAEALGIV